MKPLRILVVLPLYGGSLPVGRFAADALRNLGHLTEVFEAPDFYTSYQGLDKLRVTPDRLEYLQNSYLQVVSQAVLAKAETFEPDLLLALAQAPLTIQALKRLKRDGVATAMWFVEDYRLFTYWQAFAPHYDIFAVIQKEPFFSELKQIGQENGLYLPLAARADFHRPVELTPGEARRFGADVSFMGAGYPNRRKAFRELVDMDLKIWGTDWEGDPVLEKRIQQKGARVSSEDCVKIFNATGVNLNLHSSIQAEPVVPGGDFVNPRTFELAACGAFQLTDPRTLLDDAFTEEEVVRFHSLEDLREKTAHFLAHPEERKEYARRARERALADHTYERRMESLLGFTAERIPSRPRKRAATGKSDLPPELAAKMDELTARLGLPGDASFQDVVWALRQQSGVLSPLDASILFLDEWRKQYVSE